MLLYICFRTKFMQPFFLKKMGNFTKHLLTSWVNPLVPYFMCQLMRIKELCAQLKVDCLVPFLLLSLKKGSFWVTHLSFNKKKKKNSGQCKRGTSKKKRLRSEGCEKIMLFSSIKRLEKEKPSNGLPMIFATDFSHQYSFIPYNMTLYESLFQPRSIMFARGNHQLFIYPQYSMGSFAFTLKNPFSIIRFTTHLMKIKRDWHEALSNEALSIPFSVSSF